eukprot:jgi/Mesvir1/2140/Mv16661-RA.1
MAASTASAVCVVGKLLKPCGDLPQARRSSWLGGTPVPSGASAKSVAGANTANAGNGRLIMSAFSFPGKGKDKSFSVNVAADFALETAQTFSLPLSDDAPLVRHDWTREEIAAIYNQPLMELIYQGASMHRRFFDAKEVQKCTLLSIKTGGCSEDCKYCSQSSRYETEVDAEPLMKIEEVLEQAKRAKEAGSTRFCMGAAWREVSTVSDNQFQRILQMVSGVRGMGMEVCCTLGMLTAEQAVALKQAGLTAYNHNLDTSPEFYPKVISTRTYEDRLRTLERVRDAGISVCCGGIIGMGETHEDRVGLLHTLATLPEHPESVPVNALVPNPGTPLEELVPLPWHDLCRMIATARIVMPTSMVRLSAGRVTLSLAEQAMCFMAGANSIFTGDKLLTTPNPEFSADARMFGTLGLVLDF